jgi:hypothetical protein
VRLLLLPAPLQGGLSVGSLDTYSLDTCSLDTSSCACVCRTHTLAHEYVHTHALCTYECLARFRGHIKTSSFASHTLFRCAYEDIYGFICTRYYMSSYAHDEFVCVTRSLGVHMKTYMKAYLIYRCYSLIYYLIYAATT